jgi:hypothetical protein
VGSRGAKAACSLAKPGGNMGWPCWAISRFIPAASHGITGRVADATSGRSARRWPAPKCRGSTGGCVGSRWGCTTFVEGLAA